MKKTRFAISTSSKYLWRCNCLDRSVWKIPAVLDDLLIRIRFRESWAKMIGYDEKDFVFQKLVDKIEQEILRNGEFVKKIPMLYLEFGR